MRGGSPAALSALPSGPVDKLGPFLSSIPLLKYLTGSVSKSNNRRELLIMIQPRIVEGTNDLPPNVQDSVASSLFAEETKATFSQEKSAALKALPLEKKTASTRIKEMVKKLFQ